MTAKVAAQVGELLLKIAHFAAELGFRLRSDGVNPQSLLLPNGSRFVARPAVQESSRGYSQARFIIIDEAAFVPEAMFKALSPILAVGGGALWVISTPYGTGGRFADLWYDPANSFTKFAGFGHTVVEFIRKDQIRSSIIPICLTGGHKAKFLNDGYQSLPRTDMVNTLKMLFEIGHIELEQDAPGFPDMERELVQFQPSGDQQEHDDLVMAIAMAAWQAVKDCPDLLQPGKK